MYLRAIGTVVSALQCLTDIREKTTIGDDFSKRVANESIPFIISILC